MGVNSYNFLDVIYIQDPLAVRSISGPPGEAEGGDRGGGLRREHEVVLDGDE